MNEASPRNNQIKRVGFILLEIGSILMSSGASTERVRRTVQRIANSFNYKAELFITFSALSITVINPRGSDTYNGIKRTPSHTVNFKTVSGISRMSWAVAEEKWTVDQIRHELSRLNALPHYSRYITLPLVGLAGAAFCRFAGGTVSDLLIVFVATVAGLFVRQEITKLKFNQYLCIYFASFTASLIAGLSVKLGMGGNHEHAFATSVLFLIPGVPLINSFSDVIDGNLQNALIRGLHGFVISFAIALGLLTSMILYKFS